MASVRVDDWSVSFDRLSDEDVAALAHRGNRLASEHLMCRYRGLVESKARSYYLSGGDREDVVQEGMIGLYKAIRDFRGEKLPCFRAFAEMCITRQIITAVKGATRKKHVPMQQYVSLQGKCGENDGGTLLDILPDSHVVDPETVVMGRLVRQAVRNAAEHDLSDLESCVFDDYLAGMTYDEMADKLDCGPKSIDNALQRAKRKIGERVLAEAC